MTVGEIAPDAAAPGYRGTVFGYEVRSTLPFRFLRRGFGESIDVAVDVDETPVPESEPAHEWLPRPENALHAKVWIHGSRYTLWIDGVGCYVIDPDAPSVRIPPVSVNAVRREEHTWGLPTSLCFVRRGDLPLHAAAIDVGGAAALLAAPGRHGKTTLAASFLNAGYRMVSEDLSCCRLNGAASVIPGPAVLRVRRDIYDTLRLAGAEPVLFEDDRVHLSIDAALRGDATPVPIAGVVLLRVGGDHPRLDRAEPLDILRDLWALSFNFPNDEDRTRCFDGIASLATSVPAWNLTRPLRMETLDATMELILSACR